MSENIKNTTDIWFASFLVHNGFNVHDYDVIQSNRGRFHFEITEAEWKDMRLKFNTSDISKFKTIQISLKDLLH